MLTRQSEPKEVVVWPKERNLPAYLPDAAVREELRANGFRWVARRASWAHPCGTFSRPSRAGNPFQTYGAVPVAELATDAGASA